MTAQARAPEHQRGGASLRDRIPLLAMLAADALALVGQGIAVCLLGAILTVGGADAALAAGTAGVVAVAALAGRRRVTGAFEQVGMWRASVAADALGAVGTFAILLHSDARAGHPLVLVFGVAAAGAGIAAGLLLGPRTPAELARQAGVAPDRLSGRWPSARLLIGVLAVLAGAAGVAVIGPEVGWVSFACFVQAAEAVVVMVPYRGAGRRPSAI